MPIPKCSSKARPNDGARPRKIRHRVASAMLLAWSTCVLLFGLVALPASSASAQTPATSTSAEPSAAATKARAEGYEPVSGRDPSEQVDASKLVVIAYACFFVFMFGYVVVIARKQTEMGKEMAEIAERIEKAAKK